MKKLQWFGLACGSMCLAAVNAQTVIETFEYATDEDLLSAWQPSGNAIATLSDSVAARSTGKKSMRVEFNFPSTAWATETIRGIALPSVVSIAPTQYLSFRLRGDTNFAKADFKNLYLYAYDVDGNFGRWGGPVPVTDEWQIVNYLASTIEQPWDSTQLPDLAQIERFAFFQYGSEAAIDPYTATIYVDDLVVTDKPLTEFPPAAAPRELIDDFEGYANDTALGSFYAYQNSPATTATTATLESPAPQGNKALKLAINFAAGQWPWGSVRSAIVAPFSFPTNAAVSFRLKGDPALAAIADSGTAFWLSFYDKAGRGINFITAPDPVISSDWTTIQMVLQDLGDTSTVDIGNLVQWRILVEGWQGTAEQPELAGAFYIDDVRIAIPNAETPSLGISRQADTFTLTLSGLTVGATYEVRTSTDLSHWSTAATITATATTATWSPTEKTAAAFFHLAQKIAQ